MYIDWKKSAFIFNGEKLNYYEDRSWQAGSNTTVAAYSRRGLAVSGNSSSSVTRHEERVSFIPPHSRMHFRSSHKILSDDERYIHSKGDGDSYPIITDIAPEQSDYFRNFLTYGVTEDGTNSAYIDDEFYICRILSVKYRDFKRIYKEGDRTINYFPYKAGNTFYIDGLSRYNLFYKTRKDEEIVDER